MSTLKSTPERKSAFCTALVVTGGNVTRACEAVGIDRTTPYTWCEEDPAFEAAWVLAVKRGAEVLEDELRRRAFEGVAEPVFHQGIQVGTVQKYSDTLGIFLIKGAMPDKYRERQQVEHSGQVDVVSVLNAARNRVGG